MVFLDIPNYSNMFDYIKEKRPAVYFKNQKNLCISSLRHTSHTCVFVWAEGRVMEFPVIKIAEKDIVDTNGAGDAFVGGK